ncbi:hypothetical protein M441DRAFT_350822 [Trichoderma asperellum CBS 433.97]|uniref:Uncharacterized protein n=1 Tax=Trichoderma asperellum (strain ATCC 204424 / CBS 433.97 / NBRC 101777) TaxID=1042311 RepID=A0A2T3ZIB2_TRIA4|nr:hypothetical protein M441DRAFT_350822 [Trichoderma asperellum CBS 433.97]PTB44540.1 hypothetical protein M441DRAFT_350822 [Trichoderma asperellum CBS 433.97]
MGATQILQDYLAVVSCSYLTDTPRSQFLPPGRERTRTKPHGMINTTSTSKPPTGWAASACQKWSFGQQHKSGRRCREVQSHEFRARARVRGQPRVVVFASSSSSTQPRIHAFFLILIAQEGNKEKRRRKEPPPPQYSPNAMSSCIISAAPLRDWRYNKPAATDYIAPIRDKDSLLVCRLL